MTFLPVMHQITSWDCQVIFAITLSQNGNESELWVLMF